MALNIEVEQRKGATVIRLTGELDGTDDNALVKTVRARLDQPDARIVLDLGGVSFIGSAGLGDLVRITAQANSQGGRILLANLTPFAADLLGATGLDKFFETCPDVDAALAQMQ